MRIISRLICGVFLLLSFQNVEAQDFDLHFSQKEFKKRPRLGLALSGGAAHGLAHVGVIKYLDEIGIKIDFVTGTSMGAIIGALYAMGHTGEEMVDIAADINWDAILNDNMNYPDVAPIEKFYHDKYPVNFVINGTKILLPQGIINTNRLELVLERLFSSANSIEDFDDMPIPFKCYGVDIERGEVITLENGKLSEALRASMAIPSVFSPAKYQGKWLVDGGLMRNFPVRDNYNMGSDIVLGSFVGREKSDKSELNNLIDILSESAFMMSIKDSNNQKDKTDILFCPDVKQIGVFDFNRYQDLIDEGYRSAQNHHQELMDVLEIQSRYERSADITPVKIPEYLYIDSIKIENIPDPDQKLALDKFAFKPRTHMTHRMIEKGVSRIRSTLNFESVKYQITKNNEKNILYIQAEPREYRKLGLSINHFSDTNSSLILSAQIRNLFFRLSNLRGTLRLSQNPAASGEYFLRGGLNSKNWILGLVGSIEKTRLSFFSDGDRKKTGTIWEGHINSYIKYEFNNLLILSGNLDVRRYDFNNQVRTSADIKRFVNSGIRYSLDFNFDSRDRRAFTKKGSSFLVSIGYGVTADDNVDYTSEEAMLSVFFPVSKDYFDAEVNLSTTVPILDNLWWSFRLNGFYKSNPSLLDGYRIGGTSSSSNRNLSFIGFNNTELMSNAHVYFRSDIRLGVFERVSVSFIANALLADNDAFIYSDPNRETNYLALGAGFEVGISTPIGPILLDIGYNNEAQEVSTEVSVGWRHFY